MNDCLKDIFLLIDSTIENGNNFLFTPGYIKEYPDKDIIEVLELLVSKNLVVGKAYYSNNSLDSFYITKVTSDGKIFISEKLGNNYNKLKNKCKSIYKFVDYDIEKERQKKVAFISDIIDKILKIFTCILLFIILLYI